MHDDPDSGTARGPSAPDPLDRRQRRVHDRVHAHGPMGLPGLQADVCPYDPRAFGRALASLARAGYVEVCDGRASPAVDVDALGDPREFDPAALDGRVTVRPAVGGDFPGLLGLVQAVAREEKRAWAATLADRVVTEERIHRRDADGWRSVYVADIEGEVRGWAHLTDSRADCAVEVGGGVAPPVRQQGVGSRLLQYVLDRAGRRGVRRVHRYIAADDHDAFQFLRTRGWQVEGAGRGRPRGEDPPGLRLVTALDAE